MLKTTAFATTLASVVTRVTWLIVSTLLVIACSNAAAPTQSSTPAPTPSASVLVTPTASALSSPLVSSAEPSMSPSPFNVIHDGDLVTGDGLLLASHEGSQAVLCRSIVGAAIVSSAMALTSDNTFGCHGALLYVTNLDEAADSLDPTYIKVTGNWQRDHVSVTALEPGARADQYLPPWTNIPCQDPTDGWHYIGDGLGDERDAGRLDTYLRKHADVYAGFWRGRGPAGDIWVAGAIGDITSAQAQLAPLANASVCVTHVEFAGDELETAARRLEETHPEWFSHVEYTINRVAVEVPCITLAVAGELTADAPMLKVDPLVSAPN